MEYWSPPTAEVYASQDTLLAHTQWTHEGESGLSLILLGFSSRDKEHKDAWFELARTGTHPPELLIGKARGPEELERIAEEMSPFLPLPSDYATEWEKTKETIA